MQFAVLSMNDGSSVIASFSSHLVLVAKRRLLLMHLQMSEAPSLASRAKLTGMQLFLTPQLCGALRQSCEAAAVRTRS